MEYKVIFGDNIVGKVRKSSKFVGRGEVRLLIPENVRKPTNIVDVIACGPDSGVRPGDVVLIQPNVGYSLSAEHVLLKPVDVVGRIE